MSDLPDSIPAAAHVDREALAAVLVESGFADSAQRLAQDVAERGLRLQPTSDPVNCRLGGPALLPANVAWPHAADGHPLTFLAGLDLSELSGAEPLPRAGWLLFYGDLYVGEGGGLIEPVANEEGAPGRVFFVAPGEEPMTVEPRDDERLRLRQQPVRAEAQLTLRNDYEAVFELGLDEELADAYSEIAGMLNYGDGGYSTEQGAHWVLGAQTNVQGHPVDPETVLLLHIAFDSSLNFEFLDGGAVQFRIARAALEAKDWTAITAEPDSG